MANFIPKIEYIEKGTGIPKTVTFGNEPEGDPLNEEYKTSSVIKRTNNGRKQTQFNNNRKIYSISFMYQTEAVKNAFADFMLNHALRGGSFNYFVHNDEIEFETMKIEAKGFKVPRPIPNGSGDFEYNLDMKVERTL